MRIEKTGGFVLLAAAAFLLSARGAAGQCWQYSASGFNNDMCAAEGRICIEWGDDSQSAPVATACCDPLALSPACMGSCELSDRPLTDGMVPSPGLPGDSGWALKAFDGAAPIRPEHPVTYRGRVYGVDELAALDGKELHYLFVLDGGDGESVLYAL
ncbi:MAG: hypothetical protein AAGF23_10475, partial [Acidobacteriota bacterium]